MVVYKCFQIGFSAKLLMRASRNGPLLPEPNDIRTTVKFMQLWQRLATSLKSTSTSLFVLAVIHMTCTVQLHSHICWSCNMLSAAVVNRHREQGHFGQGRYLFRKQVRTGKVWDPKSQFVYCLLHDFAMPYRPCFVND